MSLRKISFKKLVLIESLSAIKSVNKFQLISVCVPTPFVNVAKDQLSAEVVN